ncbi:hypothetical protein IE53DRAFT_383431 [Violaceomyces palustris]|uniref:Uncharacterized protein n=1 Tax=Violaceomyces palustris TaxID=1673888 RepID=A0ACD0P7L8_9BASI|nr:hypothetical protein IE53DRAFT_383431 [Violaceomyces palustris]
MYHAPLTTASIRSWRVKEGSLRALNEIEEKCLTKGDPVERPLYVTGAALLDGSLDTPAMIYRRGIRLLDASEGKVMLESRSALAIPHSARAASRVRRLADLGHRLYLDMCEHSVTSNSSRRRIPPAAPGPAVAVQRSETTTNSSRRRLPPAAVPSSVADDPAAKGAEIRPGKRRCRPPNREVAPISAVPPSSSSPEQPMPPPPSRPSAEQPMPPPPPRFHLGVWFDRTLRHLGPTYETKQVGSSEEGKVATVRFLVWAQTFAEEVLRPMVPRLHPEYQLALEQREKFHFPKLQRLAPSSKLCHPFYSTLAVFQGHTTQSHADPLDSAPSILVNLGGHAVLEMENYGGAQVELHPFDVVFFRSRDVKHRAFPLRYDPHSDKRWAITFFFRRHLEADVPEERVDDLASLYLREWENRQAFLDVSASASEGGC